MLNYQDKLYLIGFFQQGALSVTLYSFFETAKANHLIVEKYLVYLMDMVANRDPLSDQGVSILENNG